MGILQRIASPADLRQLSIDQLPEVAAEIREAISRQVSKTGGHLAPNLGVVELTIAMHYVFDFAWDRLLFDVGHQCYPHKLLTGRQHMLAGLRTGAGMAGFPEPRESNYDLFSVGHAGTGISTAVGMARGDSLNREGFDPQTTPNGRRVATIIGDASIVNGVAMEGLNGAGTLKRQFLVVLNDNGMSISKPQGAIARYFDHLRTSAHYKDFKSKAREILKGVPGGHVMHDVYHKMGEGMKAVINEGAWFEHFGLVTIGPIDGHDFPTLIQHLTEARNFDRPMVLHVKTVKGKGIPFAEKDSSTFHSPPAFSVVPDPDSAVVPALESEGCRVELKRDGRSFTSAFGDAMADLMARDGKIVAATAAMPDGTGISKALARFPDRTFDTGICESHALDMMAGMAKTGLKPFMAVYSTFLQRAFDQCFQEVSLQGLAVRLCLDRAGLVGGDGAVHHGFCDVAILRVLPKAAIMAAMDEPSLKACLEFMRSYEEGLSSVRYPRDNCSERFASEPCPPFVLGKARCLTPQFDLDGPGNNGSGVPDVAVLAFGTCAIDAMAAADMVAGTHRVAVYDARFAKPVDIDLITALLAREVPIITVEDHSVVAGFGAAVVEAAAEAGANAGLITKLGLPDSWIYQDSRAKQMALAGYDAAGIAVAIRKAARPAPTEPVVRPTGAVARR
ncbi:MAG: 1-deoxy-D-xylulose-5-phosphate synthase [Planctomycetaceae bacterium]|jgi:1-deoxy-D-xylulose-5-phosphate synthase|nr:1-deoxy-D-xylulose-5-phosphate synthase [Phycisphaerales bacterium]MCE2652624.1 1-deoxy-D-xylulose-5-phosphate synthase [Planctomycetaceae bacterium]